MNESHKHKFEWKKPDTKEYIEDDSIPKTGQIKICFLVIHSQRVKQNERQKKKKDYFKSQESGYSGALGEWDLLLISEEQTNGFWGIGRYSQSRSESWSFWYPFVIIS